MFGGNAFAVVLNLDSMKSVRFYFVFGHTQPKSSHARHALDSVE